MGRTVQVKLASPVLVLAYRVSSWFPAVPHNWAIFAVVVCALGLLAAVLVRQTQSKCSWPATGLSILSVFSLIGGVLVAFAAMAIGTSADGAIILFFVLGFAGYLQVISRILTPKQASNWFLGVGWLALLLASWSWFSAFGMYVHRGVSNGNAEACVLVPEPVGYDTELSSIWEMRLPEIVSSRTGPTGTVI